MTAVTAPTVLAYIPSPPQGVWHLGPVPLRAYALCIIVGIIVAVFWGNSRWKARGGQDGEVLDIAIWAVPFGLVGGRVYHLITDWQTYFGDGPKTPMDAFRIWDGGLGIWGAVALGAVGAWIGARRQGIKLPPFGDAIAPAILLAQAIGRLGNYFNQELFGRETTVPWGLEIYERVNSAGQANPGLIDGVSNGVVDRVVHPTFLYEMLWNLFAVLVLVVVDRYTRIGHGRLFALYVALYCLGRFGVELLRDDPATLIAGMRINLFTAAIVFACAAAYFVIAPKGRELGLSMYHDWKADELEALGHVGYVDKWADDEWTDDLDDTRVAAGVVGADDRRAADDALTEAIAKHVPGGTAAAAAVDAGDDVDDVDAEGVDEDEPFVSDGQSTDAGGDDPLVVVDEAEDAEVDESGVDATEVDETEAGESVAEPETPADETADADETPDADETAAEDAEGVAEAAEDAAVDPGDDVDAEGVDEDEPFVSDGQSTDTGGDDPLVVDETDEEEAEDAENTPAEGEGSATSDDDADTGTTKS